MYDLERDFTVQLIEIAVVVLISIAAALAVRRRPPWRLGGPWPLGRLRELRLNPAASCLAVGSLLAVLIVTVSRRGDGWAPGGVHLVPLQTLRSYRDDPSDLLIYLLGNVALFVPLGFFLYLALGRWLLATTAACVLVSVGVEVLQLPIWSRSSDIDDVLTNSAGGFLGALAGFVALRLHRTVAGTYADGSRAS